MRLQRLCPDASDEAPASSSGKKSVGPCRHGGIGRPSHPDLDDIELERGYSMAKAYGLSKHYVIWVIIHFIGKVKNAGFHNVTFNVVHPVSTQSNLGREAVKSWKWKIIYFLWRLMLVPIDKAARSSLYAATRCIGKIFRT